MTIDEVMKAIHVKYEHNTDYYDSSHEDYKTRLALVNEKINMWENEEGILWRELFTTVTDRFDDNGTYEISDILMPANKILCNGVYYEYLSPELIQEQEKYDLGKNVFTITQEDGVKSLNVRPALANEQFTFNYYRKATTYSTGSETEPLDMADPYFVVHSVAAELFLDDMDTEKAGVAVQIATQKLEGMKAKNAAVPVFVDTKQEDYTFNGFGN